MALTTQQRALVKRLEASKNPRDNRLAGQITGASATFRSRALAEAKRKGL